MTALRLSLSKSPGAIGNGGNGRYLTRTQCLNPKKLSLIPQRISTLKSGFSTLSSQSSRPVTVTEAGVEQDDILIMRSRLGRSTGRVLIKSRQHCPDIVHLFSNENLNNYMQTGQHLKKKSSKYNSPVFGATASSYQANSNGDNELQISLTSSTNQQSQSHSEFQSDSFGYNSNLSDNLPTYRPLDRHDIRLFVEQCEAYVRFSDDLRRLAGSDLNYCETSFHNEKEMFNFKPDSTSDSNSNESSTDANNHPVINKNFMRVVTVSNVPRAYGRRDLSMVLEQAVNADRQDNLNSAKLKNKSLSNDNVNSESESDSNSKLFPTPCSNTTSIEKGGIPNVIQGYNSHHGGVPYYIRINPKNIVFNFKRYGQQSDEAFVLMNTQAEADKLISRLQEYPVPKHCKYETLFGCSFLQASRSALFLQNRKGFDFEFPNHLQLEDFGNNGGEEKFQVLTSGWDKDMASDEFHSFLNQLKFFPDKVKKVGIIGDRHAGLSTSSNTSSESESLEDLNKTSDSIRSSSLFLLTFPNMKLTKLAMARLRRLKRRWRLHPSQVTYAYPKMVDIHWSNELSKYKDEIEDDGDLDEPVVY